MSRSRDNGCGTIEKLDPENMGIAVRILLLCALELEICLGGGQMGRMKMQVRKNQVRLCRDGKCKHGKSKYKQCR